MRSGRMQWMAYGGASSELCRIPTLTCGCNGYDTSLHWHLSYQVQLFSEALHTQHLSVDASNSSVADGALRC